MPLVVLPATVTDKQGNYLAGLKAADFTLLDDGLSCVKEKEDEVLPPGSSSNPDYQGTRRIVAVLPRELFPKVEEAAEECPGECIFIEHD